MNIQLVYSVSACRGSGYRWRIVGLLLALGSLGAPAYAAAAGQAALSLAEAEALALSNDTGVQAAAARHLAESLAAPAAGQLPDPTLSVGLENVPLNDFSMTRLPNTMTAVTLTQTLPPGNTLSERQRGAEAAARAADAQWHLSRRAVVRQVADDWLAVYRAEQTIRLLKAQQRLYERLQRSAETAYSTGRVAASAWVRLGVRRAAISDQIGEAEGKAAAARARLARWVGQRAQAPWPERLPKTLTALPSGQLDTQPSLTALRADVSVARAAVGEAKAAFAPVLGVSVGYGINAGSMPNTGSVGVSVSLPLFAGSRQTPRLRAAQQRLGAAQLALDDEAAQLHAQQQALQVAIVSLDTRLANYDQHILPDLHRLARLAQNQFGAGTGDFAAVIDAEESEIAARLARLTLVLDRARQIIDLRYLLENAA